MKVYVSVEADGMTRLAGVVYTTTRRGVTSSTFTYDPAYLDDDGSYSLDPELPLVSGALPVTAELPRSFSDAAPDRWGRQLISRRAAAEARLHHKPLATLTDVDYLLGVSDRTRQGALRFSLRPDGEFQHPATDVPPLIQLPDLYHAAREVAVDAAGANSAVKLLLAVGSASLGGARPKASVMDDGKLSIAKFSHPHDDWSVIAWEYVALELAQAAGLQVPDHRLTWVDQEPVLLTERFDRVGSQRLGYLSAMTLCGKSDGEPGDYLEIAEAIQEISAHPTRDLQELWKRITFTIALHNTDDHLRNHGVIRDRKGWRLSPLFDVNPEPDLALSRVTAVFGETDSRKSFEALVDVRELFAVTEKTMTVFLDDIRQAVSLWPARAQQCRIPADQISRFTPAINQGIAAIS